MSAGSRPGFLSIRGRRGVTPSGIALLVLSVFLSTGVVPARAGEVRIEQVRAARQGPGLWTFHVTLRHEDTGWSHYADAWRVLAPDGSVLGERILLHPHENEQPFTRSLSGVAVPAGVTRVSVVAHDRVHGWSPNPVVVDLARARGDRFQVER